ncbi:DUF4147 domain-containing protein [Bacillus thuringiensis]|uniref:DUF4147 domain-containing protein n=2 Tax=Bacillus cereus group TaxID=86661 RepID=UPI0015945229|nr:DUF4147 domain-containing protein [Bacillus thuringiensis]MED3347303.1 DUF4147 domain-containing protein [Bacillus thuringiensis]HDX9692278.1 DUF4147 domain-containing protein [Bacillus thuringiensis]
MIIEETRASEHLNLVCKSIDELDVYSYIKKVLEKESINDKLKGKSRIFLIAVGKVSVAMSDALIKLLPQKVTATFIVSLEEYILNNRESINVKSTHPEPSKLSDFSSVKLTDFLINQNINGDDAVIFAISGGTSAMLMSPTSYFNLTEIKQINRTLLESGEDVTTINKIRKAISSLHGGGVLKYTGEADVFGFILNDNVQMDIKAVGSGLTFPYNVKDEEISSIIGRLNLSKILKEKILESHRDKKSDRFVKNVINNVIADTNSVAESMAAVAKKNGYEVCVLTSTLQGEVKEVAKVLGNIYKYKTNEKRGKLCIISSGELTVKVNGTGKGGRCQELAWCMAKELKQLKRESTFLAFATDGNDFIPGIAGAWATNYTYQKIVERGIDWNDILNDNNTYQGLSQLAQLITGVRTSLNLCDLYVLFSE